MNLYFKFGFFIFEVLNVYLNFASLIFEVLDFITYLKKITNKIVQICTVFACMCSEAIFKGFTKMSDIFELMGAKSVS